MRPLEQLVRAEKYIHQLVRDGYCYATGTRFGRSPTFVTPVVIKPDKINKLMVLMIHTQRDICILCGEALIIDKTLPSDHSHRPSFDHVVSKHKGGQDRGNRIAVHRQCNSIKSNRDPTGCELIWLMVVNNAIEKQSHLFLDKRN